MAGKRMRVVGSVSGRKEWGSIAAFFGPATALFLLFVMFPVVMSFFNSMHILRMDLGMQREFVGLAHFVELFGDTLFGISVKNSLIWSFVAPLIEIPAAYLLALLLYRKTRGWRIFRVAWFSPMLFSFVAVGVIFRWIFNMDWGALNVFLRAVGLDAWAVNWLGRFDTALPSLIGVVGWKFLGFNMVIFLAALHAVPEEILEAARIDGASAIRTQLRIVLPLMRPTVANLLILCFIGKMRQFELVWVMTMGGPMHRTETVATYVWKRAFDWRTLDLGYPSAIAVLWFIIILALTVLLRRVLSPKDSLEY